MNRRKGNIKLKFIFLLGATTLFATAYAKGYRTWVNTEAETQAKIAANTARLQAWMNDPDQPLSAAFDLPHGSNCLDILAVSPDGVQSLAQFGCIDRAGRSQLIYCDRNGGDADNDIGHVMRVFDGGTPFCQTGTATATSTSTDTCPSASTPLELINAALAYEMLNGRGSSISGGQIVRCTPFLMGVYLHKFVQDPDDESINVRPDLVTVVVRDVNGHEHEIELDDYDNSDVAHLAAYMFHYHRVRRTNQAGFLRRLRAANVINPTTGLGDGSWLDMTNPNLHVLEVLAIGYVLAANPANP